ncbi:LptF/LptG family permease [Spirochaetota bacterium]
MSKHHSLSLWLYIAKEFFFAFVVTFLFFFIIFFINQLLLMAEDILSKKAPLLDVIMLVFYATPAIIAMSFPFGSLVGALMASSRLAGDNEFLVMHASGISRHSIMVPFLFLGLVFSLVSFVMNDYFLPLGTINYGKLYRKLISSVPALELKPYSVKKYKDATLVMGELEDGAIRDLLILDTTKSGKSRLINTGRAVLLDKGDAKGILTLVLKDIFIQESDPAKPDRYEYSTAAEMEYNLMLSGFADFASAIGPREMASREVLKLIKSKESVLNGRLLERHKEIEAKKRQLAGEYLKRSSSLAPLDASIGYLGDIESSYKALVLRPVRDRSLEIYRLEYYKKFSIPAGAFCFIFLAFPLGAKSKKNSRLAGFGVGLLIALVYWALLIGGQSFGLKSELNPFLAMWAPNMLVLIASLPLLVFWRSA